MAKPWGGAGAWAAEAERADAERESARAPVASSTDFPDLSTAVTQTKSKKKKEKTLSFSEFTQGIYVGHGGRHRQISDSRGLTPTEQRMFPTGPRDRTGEEPEPGTLGGGFSNYGGFRNSGGGGDRDPRPERPGFGGGYEREEGRDRERSSFGRDRDAEFGPSRADENENWAAKKVVGVGGGGGAGGGGGYSTGGYSGGGGGYGDDERRSRLSDRDLPSRADEVDNWGTGKKFVPTLDSRPSFRSDDGRSDLSSRADEVDNWGAVKKFVPSSGQRGPGGGFEYREPGADSDRWSRREREPSREPYDSGRTSERPRLVLQPRTRPVESSPPPPQVVEREGSENKTPAFVGGHEQREQGLEEEQEHEQELPPKPKPRANPFGAARPREEVLAEKGLDWRKLEVERESTSRPSSSHSSRPQTPEVGSDGVVKPRVKINPFGNAKPREVLLEEKGKDYRKIDFELEHRAVGREETPDEKKLKEEIRALEDLIKSGKLPGENGVTPTPVDGDGDGEDGAPAASLLEQLREKERSLERLTRDLDDKVRFSQRGDRSLRSGRSGRSVSRERI